jgi:hypothetical protein
MRLGVRGINGIVADTLSAWMAIGRDGARSSFNGDEVLQVRVGRWMLIRRHDEASRPLETARPVSPTDSRAGAGRRVCEGAGGATR